ncbi:MAG: T9SS type A sorting domain-containing protein [Bacteroidales bacterium]|jgi:hypothetical protein|nr:T9SS type A sorting domain-containing protein [Bacteroidales bacterium]
MKKLLLFTVLICVVNAFFAQNIFFSLPEGSYFGEQTLLLSTSSSASHIYYAVHNNTESSGFVLYSTPILLSEDATVTALGVDADFNIIDTAVCATYHIISLQATCLPFYFDAGRDSVNAAAFMLQNHLGSDYASSPYLKFENTGSELVVHFADYPDKLYYNYKLSSNTDFGEFRVEASSNGSNFVPIRIFSVMTNTVKTDSIALEPNVRFVKFLYSYKNKGNVAIGNIIITQSDLSENIDFIKDDIPFVVFKNGNSIGITSLKIVQKIEIFDVSGRKIYSSLPKNSLYIVDYLLPQKGLYFVNVWIDGQNYVQKFVN